jgi:oxygen-independent coproporphyrinogen III oxidase
MESVNLAGRNEDFSALITKYDIPSPRYTSYPTVPYWDEQLFSAEKWIQNVKESFVKTNSSEGISLYLHLPFCEQLCTYCGCNKRITKNHAVETPYLEALLKEWDLYLQIFDDVPEISELHLGGGTPTFFGAESLDYLLDNLLKKAKVRVGAEFSIEVHPNYTTTEQLEVLYKHGFRRLSVGIQDFDFKVQYIINRVQTFEKTKQVFDEARKIGYTSINADIIYGLPSQTKDSVLLTTQKVKELRPDRIAFYSYAHVPWKSKAQRRYSDADLPSAQEKRDLYELGRQLFEEAGYIELGMDHFALPHDTLFKASVNGTMHRNFMGYTTMPTSLLVGLGASSISDMCGAFMQNVKEVEEYERIVNEGQLPVLKGHILTKQDKVIRQNILNLMCKSYTAWDKTTFYPELSTALERLQEAEADGLVILGKDYIQVTEKGRAFLRNICMCLDEKLWTNKPGSALFSKSI